MSSQAADRSWVPGCRAELARINGNYAIAFDVYLRVFDCDCTARQLRDRLADYGYLWAPSERAMRRWLAEMIPVVNAHKPRENAPSGH